MSESIIANKSFEFAVKMVNFYREFSTLNKEFVLSKQLLRSSISIGANVREAVNGQSKMDFIHKLAIAQKECDETLYWLELLCRTNYIMIDVYEDLKKDAQELLRIIRSIILTAKNNLKNS